MFSPGIINIGENHGRPAKKAAFQSGAFIGTGVILFLALVACSNAKTDDERMNRIVRGEAKLVRSHPQRKLHTTQETL
jgi:hypothetical protein